MIHRSSLDWGLATTRAVYLVEVIGHAKGVGVSFGCVGAPVSAPQRVRLRGGCSGAPEQVLGWACRGGCWGRFHILCSGPYFNALLQSPGSGQVCVVPRPHMHLADRPQLRQRSSCSALRSPLAQHAMHYMKALIDRLLISCFVIACNGSGGHVHHRWLITVICSAKAAPDAEGSVCSSQAALLVLGAALSCQSLQAEPAQALTV